MAVFAGYSVSLWRNSAEACVQTHPSPEKKSGTTAIHGRLSLRFFFWGGRGGDVCTGYSAEVQEGTVNASQSIFKLAGEHFIKFIKRELFTCLFQRLLQLNRMAKFYPPNCIWKNHLRQRSTKGYRLGARKSTWIPARPLGRQLSPFTCLGPHLACLRLRDGSDDGARN